MSSVRRGRVKSVAPDPEFPTWGADVAAPYWDADPLRAYRVWSAALELWEADTGGDAYYLITAGERTPREDRQPPDAAFIARARRRAGY